MRLSLAAFLVSPHRLPVLTVRLSSPFVCPHRLSVLTVCPSSPFVSPHRLSLLTRYNSVWEWVVAAIALPALRLQVLRFLAAFPSTVLQRRLLPLRQRELRVRSELLALLRCAHSSLRAKGVEWSDRSAQARRSAGEVIAALEGVRRLIRTRNAEACEVPAELARVRVRGPFVVVLSPASLVLLRRTKARRAHGDDHDDHGILSRWIPSTRP